MQNNQALLISIIIPTYNRAELIRNTLFSIENQSYVNWECIVVYDFSTDNTKDIINEFVCKDNRFKLEKNNRKKGAQGARNTGLLKAKGLFISFFDSDNIMHIDFLLKQINNLEVNTNYDVSTCYSHLIDDNNNIIGAWTWVTTGNILKKILDGSAYVDYNNALIRKSAIDKIGLLDENCLSYQEWDTHIRLAIIANYGTVHELLVSYYQRSQGRISVNVNFELNGLAYIYSKHKALWLSVVGKKVYYSKITSLANNLVSVEKIIKNEIIEKLPELKRILIVLKIKNMIKYLYIKSF